MPKYEVQEQSLINNRLYEKGEHVEYDGLPAANLKPLDAEGDAKAAEFKRSNDARVSQMLADHKDSPSAVDPSTIVKQMAEMQKQQAEQTEALMTKMAEMFAAALGQSRQAAKDEPAPAVEAPAVESKGGKHTKKGSDHDTAAPAGTIDSASA